MLKQEHALTNQVMKELDMVRKTYLHKSVWVKKLWVRRERQPKLIHIYGWKEFFDELEKTLDSNPLMRIILDTIGKPELRYYPIYSRSRTWYRRIRVGSSREVGTYYDWLNRVWDYEWNKIDLSLDKVVGWYPPILTWLFHERPTSKKHWDLLIYFIKKRYASKEINSTETSNWRSETKSSWGSKKRTKDDDAFDD